MIGLENPAPRGSKAGCTSIVYSGGLTFVTKKVFVYFEGFLDSVWACLNSTICSNERRRLSMSLRWSTIKPFLPLRPPLETNDFNCRISVSQSTTEIVNCLHLSRNHQSVSSFHCPACNRLRIRISAPALAWALSPDQRFQPCECHKASVMIAIKSSMLFALIFLHIQVREAFQKKTLFTKNNHLSKSFSSHLEHF